MAARKNLLHSMEVRQRIKTTQILNRLNNFVLGKKSGRDTCIMEPHQVTAALGLLKKVLPDLQVVDIDMTHGGDPTRPIMISNADAKL